MLEQMTLEEMAPLELSLRKSRTYGKGEFSFPKIISSTYTVFGQGPHLVTKLNDQIHVLRLQIVFQWQRKYLIRQAASSLKNLLDIFKIMKMIKSNNNIKISTSTKMNNIYFLSVWLWLFFKVFFIWKYIKIIFYLFFKNIFFISTHQNI
jgi:hypothetical protein